MSSGSPSRIRAIPGKKRVNDFFIGRSVAVGSDFINITLVLKRIVRGLRPVTVPRGLIRRNEDNKQHEDKRGG